MEFQLLVEEVMCKENHNHGLNRSEIVKHISEEYFTRVYPKRKRILYGRTKNKSTIKVDFIITHHDPPAAATLRKYREEYM